MGKGSTHKLSYESEQLTLNVNVRLLRLETKPEKKVKEVTMEGHDIERKAYLKEFTDDVSSVERIVNDHLIGKGIKFGYRKLDKETGQAVEQSRFIDIATGQETELSPKSGVDILGTLDRKSLANFVECGSTVILGESIRDNVGLHKLYTELLQADKVAYGTITFRRGDPRYLIVIVPRELTDQEQSQLRGNSNSRGQYFMLIGKLVPRKVHLTDDEGQPYAMAVPTEEQVNMPTENVRERAFVDELVGNIA